MRVLVTGGAGYIGSHTVRALELAGHVVLTLDDLSTGHRELLRGTFFEEVDLLDRPEVLRCFEWFKPEAVMHFASRALVAESVQDPRRYFHDNLIGAVNLLDAVLAAGRPPVVFSSSCATYGLPRKTTISELHQQVPVNPYGDTKLCIERMLIAYGKAYGLRHAILRYFNAAGADPEHGLGELHEPETHLIPSLLQVASGLRPAFQIFGDDHDTHDGSCVRDYVHVLDLAEAHLLALEHLGKGKESIALNLGSGMGDSVLEVLGLARRITGHPIPAVVSSRRPGDPPLLVADNAKASWVLGWHIRRPLPAMVESAWRFMQEHR